MVSIKQQTAIGLLLLVKTVLAFDSAAEPVAGVGTESTWREVPVFTHTNARLYMDLALADHLFERCRLRPVADLSGKRAKGTPSYGLNQHPAAILRHDAGIGFGVPIWGYVRLLNGGAPIRIVAQSMAQTTYPVLLRKGLTIEELKSRSSVVMAGNIENGATRKAVEFLGLPLDRMTFMNVAENGTTLLVLMREGRIDLARPAFQDAAYAVAHGVADVVMTPVPRHPWEVMVVNQTMARKDPETVVRLLCVLKHSMALMKQTPNHQLADLLLSSEGLSEEIRHYYAVYGREAVALWLEYFTATTPDNLEISESELATLSELGRQFRIIDSPLQLDRVTDHSFLRRIHEHGCPCEPPHG